MAINKPLTLPALPVSGLWGNAYLNKAGQFKVTAFEADTTKTEVEQPAHKLKDNKVRDLGYVAMLGGFAIIVVQIFLKITALLTIGGAVLMVIGLGVVLYAFSRGLTFPQKHGEVNVVSPQDVDREILELVRRLGHVAYTVEDHAKLYELLSVKAPTSS